MYKRIKKKKKRALAEEQSSHSFHELSSIPKFKVCNWLSFTVDAGHT